jgi:hypothetical protein
MKEITFRAPYSLIKKIKAYKILIGGPTDLDRTIAVLMEDIITQKIIEEAAGPSYERPLVSNATEAVKPFTNVTGRALKAEEPVYLAEEDVTGISDGLGDDDTDDDDDGKDPSDKVKGTDNELAFVPSAGGVSDSELDNDMAVEKPNEEAKADFSTFAEEFQDDGALDRTAEDIFTDMADLPDLPKALAVGEEDMVRHRAEIRKKKSSSGRKARVSSYNGEEGPEGVTML